MQSNTSISTRLDAAPLRYLARESALFLVFGYTLLAGGVLPGLMQSAILRMSAVIITLIGLAWFGSRLRRAGPSLRTSLDLVILLAVLAYLSATLFSADPRRSLIILPQVLLPFLAFYLVTDLLRSGWPVELVQKTLLLAGGFVLVLGLVQVGLWYANWWQIGGWADPIPPAALRVSAVLRHPNLVAAFLNLTLPLALVRAAMSQSKSARWGWGLTGLLILFLVFFTSSRGGWLASVGMLALLVLFAIRGRLSALLSWLALRWRRPLWLASAGAVLLAGLAVLARLAAWQLNHPTHVPIFSSRGYIWGPAWQAFLADPLSGNGPFTFGTIFIRTGGVPPGMLLAHAHNFYLNTLAETGLLGAAALALGLWVFIRQLAGLWRTGRPDPYRLAALIGLAGLGIHSLFDTPQTIPAVTLTAAVLAACGLIDPGSSQASANRFGARRVALAAALVAVVTGMCWELWTRQPYEAGLQASRKEDWPAASALFDQAARRDPALALTWFQAAFAHGMQALDENGSSIDSQELRAAIQAYETGLAIEPDYAIHWANLGRLYWAKGQPGDAIAAMRSAVRLSSSVPAFRLSLGEMLETQGNESEAKAEYEQSLYRAPFWADAKFFQQTSLRQGWLADWQTDHAAALLPANSPWSAGWTALARADDAAARAAFLPGRSISAEASLGLGILSVRSGQPAEAASLLQRSIFLTGDELWVPVWANLELARLAATTGQPQLAEDYNAAARALIDTMSVYGPGRQGNSEYSAYIFYRDSIPSDLLPGSHLDLLPDWAMEELDMQSEPR